jgi:hypothetical protein
MKAVVLLSGGLDSTVCMAVAAADGYELLPISFDYQQRHSRELASARQVAAHYGVARHLVIKTDTASIGGSALTDAGIDVPAGSMLVVMYAAANRDPAVFPAPDAFDPDRPNQKEHLAFGRGVHFCVGAPLARLESTIAFERLAARVAEIRLDPRNTFEYEPSFVLRGLVRLDVELLPA